MLVNSFLPSFFIYLWNSLALIKREMNSNLIMLHIVSLIQWTVYGAIGDELWKDSNNCGGIKNL